MTTPATEREKLSKIISDLPDEHVPVKEEIALLDYQSAKLNGSLETISMEDVRRNSKNRKT